MKRVEEEFNIRVWPDILQFSVNLDAQLITKANFIFGASTIILFFVLNKVITLELSKESFLLNSPYFILLIGTFISSLLCMLVILPRLRIFSKKQREKDEVFYYRNILKFYSRESYYNAIKDLPLNSKKAGRAYSNQIYSLASKIIPYKFKMLKYAGWTLIFTIFLSIISYFISYFN
jgi:hypothetical protein